MSSPSSFARHVAICGLDAAQGLEVDEAANGGAATTEREDRASRSRATSVSSPSAPTAESLSNPLERAYKPKLLRLIPEPSDW